MHLGPIFANRLMVGSLLAHPPRRVKRIETSYSMVIKDFHGSVSTLPTISPLFSFLRCLRHLHRRPLRLFLFSNVFHTC